MVSSACMLKRPTVTGSAPILLIIAGGILPYITALGNTFAWDDMYLVVKNPYIRGIENIPQLFTSGYWASIGKTGGLYRPLTMLSFLVEHSVAGLSPLIYHIDNILLHTACSLLVYFIVRELVEHRYAPLFAALLFAVHPVHTEAVAWVSGRAELLATLFFLLAFLAFLRRWGGRLWFTVSPTLFLLGVLSKETAAMLPAVIFLYLLLVARERRPSAFIRALAPYAVVLAVYLPVRLIVLSGHVGPEENIFQHISGYGAFLAMSKAFMYYIRLLFLPTGLSAAYLFPPPESFFSPPVVLFWSLVAAVLLFSRGLAERHPTALFFTLWLPVCLLPVSNIVPSEILMAERVLYLPSAGFCAVAGILAARAADSRKYMTFGVAALVVLSFGSMSLDRNGVWRDERSIHTELASINRRVIAEFPRYVQLYNNLADSSIILGRYQDAEDALRQAIEIDPQNHSSHFKLASVYRATGRPVDAVDELRKAADLSPPYIDEVYGNMAAVLYDLGRRRESLEYLGKALELKPGNGRYHLNYGYLLMDTGERDHALDEFRKAGELDPDLSDVFFQQGVLLGEKQDYRGAISAFMNALRIDPSNAETHLYLGAAYDLDGRRELAVREVETALRLKPGYAEAEAFYSRLK